jgi:putative transposase
VEKDKRGEHGFWRRRLWEHTIRDERDLRTHVDYIHHDPAKHGWVTRVAEWPWSSFHRYVRLGWVNADWAADPQRFDGIDFGEPDGEPAPRRAPRRPPSGAPNQP